MNLVGTKFFFQKCPYFVKEGRWENKIKMSLIKMSLFMGGGKGSKEIRPKSSFLLFFSDVVP